MKNLLTLLCLIVFAVKAHSQMRYQFTPDQEVVMTQTIDLQVLQKINDMDMDLTTTITTDLVLKVVEVNGDTARMEGMYTYMGMDMGMNMMGTEMDFTVVSNEEPEEPEMMESHRIFKSMVDTPFYIYMRNNGHVEKTEGLEVLAAKMREVTTDENVIADMERNFGPEKLRSDFARMFANYPDQVLDTGTQWTSKVTLEEMGIVDQDQLWTVGNINFSQNQMEISSKVEDLSMKKSEDQVSLNLSGDMTTFFTINTSTGWPQQMELVSNMEGTATGNGELEGMNWPMEMKMKSTTTYELQ